MIDQESPKTQFNIISPQHSPIVTGRLEKIMLKSRVMGQMFKIMVRRTRNPLKALQVINRIRTKYLAIFGEPLLTKAAKIGNRYFWRLGSPGFPSRASLLMHENEVNRFYPFRDSNGLRTLIFAITKKCPLNCEHCFEWPNLNYEEKLTTSDIIQIIHKYQDYGTTQIMLSGGEPMLRINDIYEILMAAKKGTDFWIITSGLGLTEDRARKLKAAGLTGVLVGLDHYDASKHNQFRGFESAYNCAVQAVINANREGLVSALSLCTTKSFVSKENLSGYMDLAKKLGVSFVQILEPRATGRYFGKDVTLGEKDLLLLDNFYLEYNSLAVFKDFPIINYLGYHQRKVGCFGAGNRFFYIDTDSDAHICPFCSNKIGNTLHHTPEEIINSLSQFSCHIFEKNNML